MAREIVNVTFDDRTGALTQFGLSKIMIFNNEKDVEYQEGNEIAGFTGITSTDSIYKGLEGVLAQGKQTVAVFGSSTIPLVKDALGTVAKNDFFFVVPVGMTTDEMKDVAEWASSSERMCMLTPALDTTVADLETLANDISSEQVGIFAHKGDSGGEQVFFASRVTGLQAPKQVGSTTWFGKTPNGVPLNRYPNADETSLLSANINIYVEEYGRNFTQDGKATSGAYIDVTHSKFWIKYRLKEELALLLLNRDKIPFTTEGQALINDTLTRFVNVADDQGILVADKTDITVPNPSEVLVNDKANRVWNNIVVDTTIQGAVHEINVRFILSV